MNQQRLLRLQLQLIDKLQHFAHNKSAIDIFEEVYSLYLITIGRHFNYYDEHIVEELIRITN